MVDPLIPAEAGAGSIPEAGPVWQAHASGVAELEAELAALEHIMASGGSVSGRTLPARTSVLNLVVYTDDDATASAAASAVAGLAGRHPSRTIFLVANTAEPETMESDISAHCLPGSEGQPVVCVEQVRLRVGRLRADYFPELLTPFLIADLPTFAWWPQHDPTRTAVLGSLVELADRLVVDTTRQVSGPGGLSALVPCSERVVDFSWLRLLPWCGLMAQFFDAEACRRYLGQLASLRIEYAPPTAVQAALFGGWLASRLGWEPLPGERAPSARFKPPDGEVQAAMVEMVPTTPHGAAPGALSGVIAVASRPGTPPARFEIRRQPSGSAVRTVSRLPFGREVGRIVPLPPEDQSELLGQALEQLAPSPIYQDALALAARLVD